MLSSTVSQNRGVFSTLMEIFCENSSQLKTVNFFSQKAPPQILKRVLNVSLQFSIFMSTQYMKRKQKSDSDFDIKVNMTITTPILHHTNWTDVKT